MFDTFFAGYDAIYAPKLVAGSSPAALINKPVADAVLAACAL
jgi:hypothetical protein